VQLQFPLLLERGLSDAIGLCNSTKYFPYGGLQRDFMRMRRFASSAPPDSVVLHADLGVMLAGGFFEMTCGRPDQAFSNHRRN